MIPDSNGDKATIPADNVKGEVTGIAKDPVKVTHQRDFENGRCR
ncbi:hypothetical protein [Proteus mirabilis]|nr:hypothetical protein [Proteus mirabilis]MCZ4601341.1 hypothetical protein [Proteus mirabilis]